MALQILVNYLHLCIFNIYFQEKHTFYDYFVFLIIHFNYFISIFIFIQFVRLYCILFYNVFLLIINICIILQNPFFISLKFCLCLTLCPRKVTPTHYQCCEGSLVNCDGKCFENDNELQFIRHFLSRIIWPLNKEDKINQKYWCPEYFEHTFKHPVKYSSER